MRTINPGEREVRRNGPSFVLEGIGHGRDIWVQNRLEAKMNGKVEMKQAKVSDDDWNAYVGRKIRSRKVTKSTSAR